MAESHCDAVDGFRKKKEHYVGVGVCWEETTHSWQNVQSGDISYPKRIFQHDLGPVMQNAL